jgi:PAB1-binding protein PBP1
MTLCTLLVARCGISEAEAAQLAREIQQGDTSNPHLAEERGQVVDDSGVSKLGRSAG